MKLTDDLLKRTFERLDEEGEAAAERVWLRFKATLKHENQQTQPVFSAAVDPFPERPKKQEAKPIFSAVKQPEESPAAKKSEPKAVFSAAVPVQPEASKTKKEEEPIMPPQKPLRGRGRPSDRTNH